ncbi:MAG: tannase/feruloyl esterase family alpha/beta hydrolase [bacterium]|nr:tannase/feruloyl esterase family alpha/beta hydrolase [bacterium]MCP5068260.1 tannase/feruloyl esterase family alpha/beta hydrolase [bacterium]
MMWIRNPMRDAGMQLICLLLFLQAALVAGPSLAGTANAGSFSDAEGSRIDYALAELKPVITCKSLIRQDDFTFTIISSRLISARNETPEHCEVDGLILPQVRFRLRLPTKWNGRIYMVGNGGFAGQQPDEPLFVRDTDAGLRNGFATLSTDTGHNDRIHPLGSFADDNLAALVDFGYRAVHVSIILAKRLVGQYYGQAAAYSYRNGCSGGGLQGLMSAQRFPSDFDGIIAAAPMFGPTDSFIWSAHVQKALAGAGISKAEVMLVGEAVYAKCDEQDGLKDGLIDDPGSCDFDPFQDVEACSDGGSGPCLTAAQAEAFARVYAPFTSNGTQVRPGLLVGAELGDPEGDDFGPFSTKETGWNGPLIRDDGGPPILLLFSRTFFRYMIRDKASPALELKDVDLEELAVRDLDQVRKISDDTDPDLSDFKKEGGKIISYFGLADGFLSPVAYRDYYELVDKTVPGTHDFFRLFMVPGMYHCSGGRGVDFIDAMTPLIEWVEAGVAPDRITGHRIRGGKHRMSRPLCPHPLVARYNGEGDTHDAANFACVGG